MIRFDLPWRRAILLVTPAALVALALALVLFGGEEGPPNYQLAAVRTGDAVVPRAFLADLPADALSKADIAARKDIFVRTILPLVLRSNEAILSDRTRLLALIARQRASARLSRKDRAWLGRLAVRYGENSGDFIALAQRVDIIPPALALTQAAVESGWGTSRFAREGNALFGLRTFGDAPALIPAERENDGFAVRRYERLADSVDVYLHTLNTHLAYRELRRVRGQIRAQGGAIDARVLLPGLGRYAENEDYLSLLNAVMRDGRLWEFDGAALDGD